MSEDQHGSAPRLRRERWVAAAVVLLLVLARSAVFVFWEQSYFDSDQAVIGLMAKHLIQQRAFPVFYYGQNYMLGVEAYLAVPFFLAAGISVMALKLPLLFINIGVAFALLWILDREVGLRPYTAMIPVLFFAIPSPTVTAEILAPNGGNVAPFAYIMLVWLTRKRPGWCGFFFGLGFLQREFTLYALIALLAVEAIQGVLWTREGIRRRLAMLRTSAEVWLVVQLLKAHSSAAGPGTSTADLTRPRDSILELSDRFCSDPTALPRGANRLFSEHFGVLFGTRPMSLADLSIQSTGSQGFSGAWIIVLCVAVVALAFVARHLLTERRWKPEYNFCAYLVIVAACSELGYVAGRCGELYHQTLRYELLSVLGMVGLGAWFLRIASWRAARRTWIALALAMTAVTALPHARLLVEYIRHTPDNPKRDIARHLEARGIKYALADYWRSYAITFLTDERIIVASDDFQRIREYRIKVEAHHDEAVRLAREFCPGGKPLMPGAWVCPL
jgi:hypothetical protein